jgi:hypothetical protein
LAVAPARAPILAMTRPGRPPFEPTEAERRMARTLAAYGVPRPDIAQALGCSVPTLRRRFVDELARATTEANARVAETLFRRATGDGPQSVTAAIFWLKCRAGWRELDPPQGRKAAAQAAAREAGRDSAWGNDLQIATLAIARRGK